MFYLFSSASSTRYKTDVLDTLCYPEDHIFRFRYQDKYVDDEIGTWANKTVFDKLTDQQKLAVVIYAEESRSDAGYYFKFYPLREVQIIQIQKEGSIFYVDFKFGKFINYFHSGRDKAFDEQKKFQSTLNRLDRYPLPPLKKDASGQLRGKIWSEGGQQIDFDSALASASGGYFFNHVEEESENHLKYSVGDTVNNPNQAWESVVEVLSQSPSMNTCIFYLIEGFYTTEKKRWFFGEWEERLAKSRSRKLDSIYPLPMGRDAVLKLLFYRSSKAVDVLPRTLEIKAGSDAFAGFSQKEIAIHSRYNEERILIASKRVLDDVLSPISIELVQVKTVTGDLNAQTTHSPSPPKTTLEIQGVAAPRPFLLTQVSVPKRVVGVIILGLILAPLLLSLGPDILQDVGGNQFIQEHAKGLGDWLIRNKLEVTFYSKIAAAVVTFVVGVIGFRRIPLGK